MMNAKDMHVQGPQINQFNNLAPHAIPRSAFKRDFTRRTTFNQDYLVPIFLDEILPGDQVKIRMTALTRMSTPIKPLMDNLYQETFWFLYQIVSYGITGKPSKDNNFHLVDQPTTLFRPSMKPKLHFQQLVS